MTIIIYDDIYLRHDTGRGHPESCHRLSKTTSYLKSVGICDRLEIVKPVKIATDIVSKVHDIKYIEHIKYLADSGGGMVDPDTIVSPQSYETALYAAGACVTATDKIFNDECKSAFCLVRPPGHHALSTQGMGFCLFNNVAIAARYIQAKYNIKKILIVDWDVHHGNGTQDIFYDDPSVLYFSIHRYPYYPGTGSEKEKGSGDGIGSTINVPLSHNTEPDEYKNIFKKVINGAAKEFEPQFIIISSGFDAYINDPIGGLGLEFSDFGELTEIVVQLAYECCDGRVLSCLEGGYSLTGLPRCIEAHLNALP